MHPEYFRIMHLKDLTIFLLSDNKNFLGEYFEQKYLFIYIKINKMVNWSYAQIIFPSSFAGQGVLNMDPDLGLDGARPANTSVALSFFGNMPMHQCGVSETIFNSKTTIF
jgi:hypothetical protein